MGIVLKFIIPVLLIIATLLAWLTLTPGGLRWAYQQAEFYLPGEISLNRLEGKLIGPITAQGVEYSQDGMLMRADQISIDWLPRALLSANISISRIDIQSLNIVLPGNKKADPALAQDKVPPLSLPDIQLPWRTALKNTHIDGLRITQDDKTVELKQLRLNASSLFNQIDIDELSIEADPFRLAIKGELQPVKDYHHALDLRWQARLPSGAVIHGEGKLNGNLKTTRLKQQLSGPLQLSLNAELDSLLEQFHWSTDVNVRKFDTAKLDTRLPSLSGALTLQASGDLSTAALSGKLQGKYPELGQLNADFKLQRLSDNHIQIDRLKLNAPDSATQLETRGVWKPGSDGGDVRLTLNWEKLRWPMQRPAWFNSASGNGSIEGNIRRYKVELSSDSPWPDVIASSWQASADGDLEGLTFHTLRVTAMNGEAVAKGRLNWSPAFNWDAEIQTTDANPAIRWPQWPGRLNASLTSNGGIDNGQLYAQADISRLSGILRDVPLTLNSQLNWRDSQLDIQQFELHSGTTEVNLSGQAGETLKLDWSIASSDVADLYPQAKGQLQAKGRLTGPQQTPVIQASLNGRGLQLEDNEVGQIQATVDVDLNQWYRANIKLEAESLKLQGYALQSLDINTDKQGIVARAVSTQATVQLELRGEAHAQGWRGRIQRADIQTQDFANWTLQKPASLNIDENQLETDNLCWHNEQQATLCTSLNRKDKDWQSTVELSSFSLMQFKHWLPPGLKLESPANARADFRLHTPDQLVGTARIKLPAGIVKYPLLDEELEEWAYRGGRIDLALRPEGLEASSELALSNGDQFKAELTLAGFKALIVESHNAPLQASASLSVHNPAIIEALIPEIQQLRGELEFNLSAGGTLAQPRLTARAHLLNASLQIPRLGLTIDPLRITAQSDDFEQFSYQLDARSGEGDILLQGKTRLDRAAGWPTEISITGKDFEVSRIPEARVLVSPDLHIKLVKRSINIEGAVHIPFANLQPRDTTTAVRTSDDTVILGAEQAVDEKWLITTQVRLTLGERVNFFGFGFDGRLGGSLLLQDEPGQFTKASGEISIPEGRYRAYGQRLDVEHGRLLYTGGPITNPGLDLRAVRHINEVTAGISVKGSLSQPRLDLFSSPAMGQTDALSYLLLGRPIENASGEDGATMAKAALALGLSGGDRLARSLGDRFGLDDMRVESSDTGDQASLVIGRYLSPKLYVSYGVGLVESVNTLSLRYTISDKWQLKAESGEYQGADFLYTFEK